MNIKKQISTFKAFLDLTLLQTVIEGFPLAPTAKPETLFTHWSSTSNTLIIGVDVDEFPDDRLLLLEPRAQQLAERRERGRKKPSRARGSNWK